MVPPSLSSTLTASCRGGERYFQATSAILRLPRGPAEWEGRRREEKRRRGNVSGGCWEMECGGCVTFYSRTLSEGQRGNYNSQQAHDDRWTRMKKLESKISPSGPQVIQLQRLLFDRRLPPGARCSSPPSSLRPPASETMTARCVRSVSGCVRLLSGGLWRVGGVATCNQRHKSTYTPPPARYGGRHTVTLIPGDGIGPELAHHVRELFRFCCVPVDFEVVNVDSSMASEDDINNAIMAIRRNGVALKDNQCEHQDGSEGKGTSRPTTICRPSYKSRNNLLRTTLDLYANVMHCQSLPGVRTRHRNVDIMIIRENTEGEYSSLEHENVPGVVECLKIITKAKSLRIADYAFRTARATGRRRVTAVRSHKANIMKLGDGLFLECCKEVASGYPEISFDSMIVDNTTMQLVSRPQQFDVMVMPNLYGNVVSNVCAGLVGGPGLVPGANYGENYAVFETGTRNTGKSIANRNTANPTAMLLASCLLLDHLKLHAYASMIRRAILSTITETRRGCLVRTLFLSIKGASEAQKLRSSPCERSSSSLLPANMSVSTVTDSYPSIVWPVASVSPAGTNVTNPERDALLAVAEVVVLAVILVMALLGNGLVLVVLLRRRRHHNPLHQFMLNLCLADLVVALFQVLPQLVWEAKGRFTAPDFLCRLVKYLQVLGMFASSYMIVAMTMDRHYAICCPLQAHRSAGRPNAGTASYCWPGGCRCCSACHRFLRIHKKMNEIQLPHIRSKTEEEVAPGVYDCWGHFAESWGLKAYVTWMTLAVFILPVLVITVCQVRIFKEIHNNLYLKSERRLSPASFSPSKRDSQRGGGRGRSSLPIYISPLTFNNPGSHPSFDSGSTCQHLPMSPLRSNSVPSQYDIHSYTAVHPAELQPDVLPDTAAPPAVCCPLPKAHPARGGGVSAAMSKTVRMTLVIVLVYSLCWAPFFSVQLWAAWDPDPPQNGVVFTLLMLLASLNSCTNPWIYSAFSSSVSPELRLLLLCRGHAQRRGSLPNDSTTTHTSNY
ncbi:hypothetical protein L3Q82_016213 [Scortum barcoo]|uniref:Uncharacterized protein n=1 Tax=Scortum barcoo TaxID=214431 RepID=A0ACB8VQ79_9TELE|nr:hypothetical protein L3Q82_016213 [Scortum barcoo]